MRNGWRPCLQIAFTYVGTVVGAGFASGREIYEFFVRYGVYGLLGITIAAALFVWAGIRIMIAAHRIQAHSYRELNTYVFGRTFARLFNAILAVVLLGTTSVMLAATGALFAKTLHVPEQAGIWLSMAAIYAVTVKGLRAIHSVNSVFVPTLIAFMLLVFWYAKPWENGWSPPTDPSAGPWSWLRSPLYYAALNVSLAQAVLVPIGQESKSERPLVWGGVLGGLGIGLLLVLGYVSISTQMPEIQHVDMPLIYLLSGSGKNVSLAFALLVYAEVISTLVANVFGLVQQLKRRVAVPPPLLAAGILGVSYAVSFVGFASLLSLLYPLFGRIVVLFLAMLLWRQLQEARLSRP